MELDVRSAFISVVDHLPSDIIRDLWLIQSLNTTYASNEKKLDALLKEIKRAPGNGNGIPRDEYLLKVKEVNTLAESQLHLRKETLEQARSIVLSIKLTKMQLENQFSQLQHDQQLYQNSLNNYNNNNNNNNSSSSSSRTKQRNNKRTSKTPNQKLTLTLKLNLKKESPKKLKVTKKRQQHSKTHPKDLIETAQQVEEERYCICNRASFGEMVACDNPSCKIEWFHYPCVGLTRAPRGKWYCPNCTKKMNKRKH